MKILIDFVLEISNCLLQQSFGQIKNSKNIQPMISQSFLRNYSLKKVLSAAGIEKDRLKVFYTKSIRQFLKENKRKANKNERSQCIKQEPEVFYKYTQKNLKTQKLKEIEKIYEKGLHLAKSKTPLRRMQIKFSEKKGGSDNRPQTLEEDCHSPLKQFQRVQNTSHTRRLLKRKKESPYQYLGCVGQEKRNSYIRDSDLYIKDESIFPSECIILAQTSPIRCLKNEEIIRCSSVGCRDNYKTTLQQSIKKSSERGERFKRRIRRKYEKVGVKRIQSTEIDSNLMKSQ